MSQAPDTTMKPDKSLILTANFNLQILASNPGHFVVTDLLNSKQEKALLMENII